MTSVEQNPPISAREPAYFPPISAHDWAGVTQWQRAKINPNAARMVYDVCWFILKDQDASIAVTRATFGIALHRFGLGKMPAAEAYTSWLTTIASNEAHRHLEENRALRHSSALLEADEDRAAHFLADALSELRIDYKLLLILRYRFNASPQAMSKALDMRPRRVARVIDDARKEFKVHSSHSPSMLGGTHPPLSQELPVHADPYDKKEMHRNELGYEWLGTHYPYIPERDELRTKWITFALTMVIVFMLAILATRPFGAERPTLIEPDAQVEIIDE